MKVFASALTVALMLVIVPSSGGADRRVASEVPAAIKRAGVLRVATNGSFDSDLARALANLMGLRVKFSTPPFPKVLPGVAAGRYDLGMYSITDTKAREKVVDFVTYFASGISFYVASGGPAIDTLADLCGHKVGVPMGTVEEQTATTQKSVCEASGLPSVEVVSFDDEAAATDGLLRAQVDVAMADTPIASQYVRRSAGTLKLTGRPFDVQPYGIATAKRSGLAKPLLDGLKILISNGKYLSILTRRGLRVGAVDRPRINGAVK